MNRKVITSKISLIKQSITAGILFGTTLFTIFIIAGLFILFSSKNILLSLAIEIIGFSGALTSLRSFNQNYQKNVEELKSIIKKTIDNQTEIISEGQRKISKKIDGMQISIDLNRIKRNIAI